SPPHQRPAAGPDRPRTGRARLAVARLEATPPAATGPTARNPRSDAPASDRTGARQPPVAPATRHSKKNFGHCLDDVTERYQRIEVMAAEYPLTQLCSAFNVSRSGYYAWREREPSA